MKDTNNFDSASGVNFISEVSAGVQEHSSRHVSSRNILRHFLKLETLLIDVAALLSDRSVRVKRAVSLIRARSLLSIASSWRLSSLEAHRDRVSSLMSAVRASVYNFRSLHSGLLGRNNDSGNNNDLVSFVSLEVSERNRVLFGVQAKLEIRNSLLLRSLLLLFDFHVIVFLNAGELFVDSFNTIFKCREVFSRPKSEAISEADVIRHDVFEVDGELILLFVSVLLKLLSVDIVVVHLGLFEESHEDYLSLDRLEQHVIRFLYSVLSVGQ